MNLDAMLCLKIWSELIANSVDLSAINPRLSFLSPTIIAVLIQM